MRSLLLFVVACGASPKPVSDSTVTSRGVPLANVTTRTCADAAHGIEGATKGVRDPEQPVFDALRAGCESDSWPTAAIECFATMREGDLGRCSQELSERSRESVFGVLAGNEPSTAGIVVARARLEQLHVGVPECDRFVTAVSNVLACDAMPLETRINLGNETAQFWSLPTERLRADDVKRIADACSRSLLSLAQQSASVGCTP
jgi:hypothetical protein